MRSAALAAIAACVLVAGCMTGPDYERPAIDAPAQFQYATAAAVETGDAAWWKAFGDPVLDALVAEALAHNDNVKIAVANLEQAAAVFTQSRSQLFPQIGYDASAARSRSPQPAFPPEVARLIPNPDDAYRAGLSASWEIDFWGRIRRLTEAARAQALASDEARRGVIVSLVAGVATN